MLQRLCSYNCTRKPRSTTIKVNCRFCPQGTATLLNATCRNNLFQILQQEPHTTKLILNHGLIQVYHGKNLEILKELANFAEEMTMSSFNHRPPNNKNEKPKSKTGIDNTCFEEDPYEFSVTLKQSLSTESNKESHTNKELKTLLNKATFFRYVPTTPIPKEQFYRQYIRAYIRPGFIDSYIQLNPPPTAVFYDSYQIKTKSNQLINTTIYTLKNKPEKLYFIIPPEYELPQQHLLILEEVRHHLSNHHPEDTSFINQENARTYFKRFAKKTISKLIEEKNIRLTQSHIEQLSTIFAKYTAGLGILEDLLEDHHIQDVYVNAPVAYNPLHLVLNGEEHTSNIFLSNDDIEALSSRFRTESGRAFSEAAPVLDMDLQQFHTRVAAISNPLTPKGIAFAFRRHRRHPWTLPQFIANNMLTAEAAGLLSFLIDGQASLLVAGSRGAGKTSLLSALILEIPQRFRILSIEDTAEIPVEALQHQGYKIQSLLTKSIASGSLSTEVHPTDALRTALRLGESVLILGEVRGVEAKVLFEAMRVGAAGNLIMGTIHGATTKDVFERIVYDIGIPPTSFKAVDAVAIAAPIRDEGGIDRKRKLIQLSEIKKNDWKKQPSSSSVFQDLMCYDNTIGSAIPTDLLSMGQSEIVQQIAQHWGISIEKALKNIRLRAAIKACIARAGKTHPQLLEAEAVKDANNAFWQYIEESRATHHMVNYDFIKKQWTNWFSDYQQRMVP